jgi:UDP-hydrolysing UDP-N-acetyl-D-glucosamine 2-epimerase
MAATLEAIRDHPRLCLQIVATGMHLDPTHGQALAAVEAAGYTTSRVVPWPRAHGPSRRAAATGTVMARLARVLDDLRPDMVLVVGDRVEAFAAASAAHLCDLPVAHIHGGDRALGQADDSLRHAITKLAHLHFPATRQSAHRLIRLGEDGWRIRRTGAPGIDGIRALAESRSSLSRWRPGLRQPFAMLVLHPTEPDPRRERRRAEMILAGVLDAGVPRVVIVDPNNDPGARGIAAAWRAIRDPRVESFADLPRRRFLGLLRDAAFLIGNSSSGIIEAASFGTPVIDVGPRQSGREHGRNVLHCTDGTTSLRRAIARVWRGGESVRYPSKNPYGGTGTGRRIARVLASIRVDSTLLRKRIAY